MGAIPKEEMPDVTSFRALAEATLPSHYHLRDVRCVPGTEFGMPTEFQMQIELDSDLDEHESATPVAIDAFQAWHEGLDRALRAKWSPGTVGFAVKVRVRAEED